MADRKTERGAKPTGEDLDLWRQVTQDARPLAKAPKPPKSALAAPEPEEPPPPKPKPKKKPVAHPAPPPPAAPRKPPPPLLETGTAAGIDKRSMDRLRRGKLAPEATIDLHGMRREEAHRALDAFLGRSQAAGKRCVLVITGKGTERVSGRPREMGEETGVLKRQVPRWLNESPNRGRIIAFVQARPQHGGAGALYVLLKRQRGT
jgi:DNA-nicking Smr family endonuclease